MQHDRVGLGSPSPTRPEDDVEEKPVPIITVNDTPSNGSSNGSHPASDDTSAPYGRKRI